MTIDNIRRVLTDHLTAEMDSADVRALVEWWMGKGLPLPQLPGRPDKDRIIAVLTGAYDPGAPVQLPTSGRGSATCVAEAQRLCGNTKFAADWRRLGDQYHKVCTALTTAGVPDIPGNGGLVQALEFFLEGDAMKHYRTLAVKAGGKGWQLKEFNKDFYELLLPESAKSALRSSLRNIKQSKSQSPPEYGQHLRICLLYTSPSPRDLSTSRMPSSA